MFKQTILEREPTLPTIHVALVHHKHGINTYIARTAKGLLKQIGEYCREYWSDADLPMTPDGEPATEGMDDQEIADTYFDAMDELGEYCETMELELGE